VQVDIPLFRGGAVRTQVAQARLRIDQARERLRDVELLIGEDLDRALTSLSDSRNRIGVTGKNVEAAAETLRIEQTTYQEGRNTVNDVLDAQAARLTADVEYSQAVVYYLLAQLDWEREEALVQAVWLRLRPVLMTTVSTFVGMLPIILETAIGLERMSPLASAAGFGLLVGTFMTMVVTPVLYSVLDDAKTSWRSIWERR
jgi:hypothetical protein